MVIYVPIVTLLLLLSGCVAPYADSLEKENAQEVNGAQQIKDFQVKQKQQNGSVPQMMLPPVYEEPSIFGEEKISFAAEETKLSKLLYSLSQTSGLNLIIDKDVDLDTLITMTIQDGSVEDVLNILMEISGNYYILKGNILHIKQYMEKSFDIPYIHATASFSSDLGGNTLNSTEGIKGGFKLKFNNSEKSNDFYGEIDKNLASMISEKGKYTLNTFTGSLNVYDKKVNIDAIEKMLNAIKKKSSRQVLIQAKILEVVLNKGHALGVDWSAVGNSILRAGDRLNFSQTLGLSGAVAGTMNYTHNNFTTMINALDSAGDVDTLSNPRIKVLSGSSALITSGKLVPYWEKNLLITPATATSPETRDITYDRRDILDGVTLGVTPTIMKNGEIMLNIIPVSSSIEKEKQNIDEDGVVVSTAPVINIKEAGTVIFAKDNDLVMIGGLINNVTHKTKEHIPFLGSIPYLGALFSKTINTVEKRELVILLKLSIE